jgi:hypothetical protein
VLYLLTSAAMAHAECAWALWGHFTRKSDLKEESFISQAFERKTHCDEQATDKNSRERPGQYARDAASTVFWQCLPDTVDPRGAGGLPVGGHDEAGNTPARRIELHPPRDRERNVGWIS